MSSSVTSSAHSAAGAYQGFSLQDVRLAYHLIAAPAGSRVSIEHEDDVAVHYPDGSVMYEQVKSAPLSNPLADSARDLWKTLANWATHTAKVGTTGGKNRFRLYVVPHRSGVLAESISAAATKSEADAVLLQVDALIKNGIGKQAGAQIAKLKKVDIDIQRYVIQHTTVESVEDPYKALRVLMGDGVTLSPAVVGVAMRFLIGAAQTEALKLMDEVGSAILDADMFRRELQSFIARTNMKRMLPAASEAEEAAISSRHAARPVFVKQLELVHMSSLDQLSAVGDYLQASASKTMWAAEGLVLGSAFDEWDKTLIRAHKSYHLRVRVDHATKKAEDRGQALLSHCLLHKALLDGDDVGPEFVSGSFHDLADRRRLGWHEDFDKLLDLMP